MCPQRRGSCLQDASLYALKTSQPKAVGVADLHISARWSPDASLIGLSQYMQCWSWSDGGLHRLLAFPPVPPRKAVLGEGSERTKCSLLEGRGDSGESHPFCSAKREEEARRSWEGAKEDERECIDEVGKECCRQSLPVRGGPKRNCRGHRETPRFCCERRLIKDATLTFPDG